MNGMIRLLGVALLLGLAQNGFGQIANLRTVYLSARQPVHIVDTLTLAPVWLARDSMTGDTLPATWLQLRGKEIHLDTAQIRRVKPDYSSIRLDYRVLPYDLNAITRRLDTSLIRRPGYDNAIEFDYSPYETSTGIATSPGLRTNGAYTRGLSFGNSQNLVFNSNLNLQLDGKLGDDLNIRAAISDNSAPLQADGSTRQLQEFDRILLEIQRKNTTLTAGDIDLAKPGAGYFSNYFKRMQGGWIVITPPQSASKLPAQNPGWIPEIKAGGGVSKGKFNRQSLQGQEGNQGPYRLLGAEGERFIIVLSGTEKVYADGQLLQRGAQDDYVIDYNLGEITFTPKRLITKDIRIIIEFEYAVQNYLRSAWAAQSAWTRRRASFWFNAYAEQDSRSPSGAQELSADERSRLALAGDSLQNAFASGIDTLDAYDPAKVLYRQMDTVVCGMAYSILIYSTDQNLARYSARFSEVGTGKGHYITAPNSANGRVYQWSPPDPVTCAPTGNFDPIIRLIAPEQRQLHTAGARIKTGKKGMIEAEAALSGRDLNRFSPLGNADNLGAAAHVRYEQGFQQSDTSRWKSRIFADAESLSAYFTPLNPYRSAEFSRDWNILQNGQMTEPAIEMLAKGGAETERKRWGALRYEIGAYQRGERYQGGRHRARLSLNRHGWESAFEINALKTQNTVENTRFSRPKIELAKTIQLRQKPVIRIGVYAEREKNTRTAAQIDTLRRESFWYDMGRFYFATIDKRFNGYFSRRDDYTPAGRLFIPLASAVEAHFDGQWNKKSARKAQVRHEFGWNLTWRDLQVRAPERTDLENQRTWLGRTDYALSAWKNALILNSGYELGSGQTPKVEWNYLMVNPGEGQYTWIDRNRDSVLTLDEMEIAVFADQAAWIRVAVSTTEYVRTHNSVLNHSLRIEPRQWWGPRAAGWRRYASRLSMQNNWQINRRTLAAGGGIAWNPLDLNIPDSLLVTVSSILRNALWINRGRPAWDASFTQNDSRSRLLVTTGFESRRQADYGLRLRVNLAARWSIEGEALKSRKDNAAQNFVTRNFQIESAQFTPKLTWLAASSLRFQVEFLYKNSQNRLENFEKATQNEWRIETNWNPRPPVGAVGFKPATALRAKLRLADIRYDGQANTPVAFAMLEGLQNGRNWLWSLTLDRQLSKTMQLNIAYEGRRTGTNSRLVHVGRAQVRAVF